MLVNAIDILNKARDGKYAIPQFNINNVEWTKYILEECEKLESPVILGVSEGAVKYIGGFNTVSSIVRGLLEDLKLSIPVVLHLDHGSSFDSCKMAIDSGFTSVMIDASNYNLEKNIMITKEVVNYALSRNVSVEAEIGHIGGTEDGLTNEILYASVDDSVELVKKTNLDFLAPALGSVHGLYSGEPKLNFERMKQINDVTNKPLVLHGGTGIPDDKIKTAIQSGISKININTELQIGWAVAVRNYIKTNEDVYDPRKIISSGEEAIKTRVREKVLLFGSYKKI